MERNTFVGGVGRSGLLASEGATAAYLEVEYPTYFLGTAARRGALPDEFSRLLDDSLGIARTALVSAYPAVNVGQHLSTCSHARVHLHGQFYCWL